MKYQDFLKKYNSYVIEVIKEYKKLLILVSFLFFIGFALGTVSSIDVFMLFKEVFAKLLDKFKDAHGINLLLKIFFHNLFAVVIAITLGFIFGIFPIISALTNGFIIGLLLATLNDSAIISPAKFVLALIPHGIFEIPALFLSFALGINLGSWPFKKDKKVFFKNTFNRYLSICLKIIIPFLFIAAIIETIGIEATRAIAN
ncbi:stage II sporulation protein M [bacterium]|nr:stage II sporulation protein M [bacterium]